MKKIIAALVLFPLTLIAAPKPPRLIVQLVVDQLRGDLLHQYSQDFGDGGFHYLLTHSLDYQNAHHPHAHTVTCVGHATIATGAYPTLHGVVANDWFDPALKKSVYCMEDQNSPILPTPHTTKTVDGRSPRNLLASTLSDELVLSQKGRAFGVSFKDRAAITLAGHAGKAFWFDKENGGFVTSQHYYSAYPAWVADWNSHYQPAQQTWTLSKPVQQYHYAKAPGLTHRFPAFGYHFPHHLGKPGSDSYYKFLSMSPYADELTADFAIQLLQQEKLGTRPDQVDYLGISFSAVDAVGHQFGPNSLESEDNLLRLNQTLGQLLKAIDEQVGLENTLIVLTADHGVSDSPAFLASHQMKENKRLDVPAVKKQIAAALVNHFQLPAATLLQVDGPYVYLDHQLIHDHQLSVNTVSTYLAEVLRQRQDIFQAYPLPLRGTEYDWLSAKVDKMAFPGRAGDLYLVPPPYQAMENHAEARVDHGSPWNYDSYVPLLFVNPAFKPQRLTRPVETIDIAPTLAALLLIKAPSATIGHRLEEVTKAYEKNA
ncbi:alkaline phosphatase family protein [Legionella erythra]|uniref:Alkaline phosphatase n=1 Tax=Legionella erythra TaxID=448 RepID=A0A0W0TWR1_LEGER|nr:alkaline phosphatase family protein [Legionella erythra]KTC99902.1 alkaline phosphatase [Legionella erythra]